MPAASVTTTWISTGPSGAAVESQLADQGPDVSVATVEKEAAPETLTWKATEATPEVASEAAAASAIVPERTPPAAGAVTTAVSGAVLSTVLPSRLVVEVLPTPSVIRTRRS